MQLIGWRLLLRNLFTHLVSLFEKSNFYNYRSLGEAFRSIINQDGFRGLFAGYGATFIRDAPFAGIYLFFYEGCKASANEYIKNHNLPIANAMINLSSGVVAGLAATCTTQPFDMLKTRMQLKPMMYKNMIQSAKKVYREEGLIGFFDGISVRLIRKPLNSAISWTIYEEVERYDDYFCLKSRGIPKALLPISGKPVLSWFCQWARKRFSHLYILTNAYNPSVLFDIAFLYRVRRNMIQGDIVITVPELFAEKESLLEDLFRDTTHNFVTRVVSEEKELAIAFGMDQTLLKTLEDDLSSIDSTQILQKHIEKESMPNWRHDVEHYIKIKTEETSSQCKIIDREDDDSFAFVDPALSLEAYSNKWMDCLDNQISQHMEHQILQTEPIHVKTYARVGLMGNPSDGFYGKTLSLLISNFWAEVTLFPNTDPKALESIQTLSNPISDPRYFYSMASLVSMSEIDGYDHGDRLLQACCKVFYRHCRLPKHKLQQGFKMRFLTNIPRQVGLAGSSAIITALWKALMQFYQVDIPLEQQASLVLQVEQEELGIAAGLQDRVIQAYGGLVYMDFNKAFMDQHGHGQYERLDVSLVPKLWLAYVADPEDSGKVHSTVKERFRHGDQEVIKAMQTFASFTDQAKQALQAHDTKRFAELMTANFELRRQIYGDDVIGKTNLRMVELARQHHCAAKFPGSGGAVVGMYAGEPQHEQKRLLNLRRALEDEGYVFMEIQPKEY
ncbi:hypothetical protein BDF20DRAFT_829811 [Mycotypha africana]|uniref:uncharacterized protein n=1 Tax=Mycotypha africana TaxID=64632 RepID=UPI0023002E7E|nr:uncharacterized protein BDF20DRAFT_829811 [Mycotypha africana]KAI8967296.1 hypothetical protein BDF20DRAFT_829811 [Mycotypha africana]